MKAGQRQSSNPGGRSKNTLGEIQRMEKEREARRRHMEEKKQERAAEEQRNRDMGLGDADVDFQRMIQQFRDKNLKGTEPHTPPGQMKICICVRKRPVNSKEIAKNDHDSVTCDNPLVVVHDCKLRVDGITKYLDNSSFRLDHTFHENDTTEDIYMYSVQPLADFVLDGGRATVFAYGQTGSGKTFTMTGIQKYVAEDLFHLLESDKDYAENLTVAVSFFEIYGGRCQDLLNHRNRLDIREDGKGEVQVAGLEEVAAKDSSSMLSIIDLGNRNRTTHATESNDVSSRSHAICSVVIRSQRNGRIVGKLSLIDLAGSERGADTKSHNRQRRMEGAEINKSLLALKECIRALDCNSNHVPYRASKLTLVLKDSFTNKNSRTVMIVNVSPTASSADHTLNTLRYADRVKERKPGGGGGAVGQQGAPPLRPDVAKRIAPPSSKAPQGNHPPPSKGPEKRGDEAKGRGWGKPSRGGAREPIAEDDEDDDELTPEKQGRDDDLHQLHMSLRNSSGSRSKSGGDEKESADSSGDVQEYNEEDAIALETLHRTVQGLFEEEEALLNLHMNVIQENAELLTEEGRLLQQIQGEGVVDYDIDGYAQRLEEILQRKQQLVGLLQKRLKTFRRHLQREESQSRALASKNISQF